jgi:hypothetical protein
VSFQTVVLKGFEKEIRIFVDLKETTAIESGARDEVRSWSCGAKWYCHAKNLRVPH